ncbi:MAG: LysR family transcriptional regulator, partial [Burkholderiaceae bacterium]|nr:LysR family transcriptional regulator [Burkholderiaceae bacterium]
LDSHAPIRATADLDGHTFISYVDDLLFSKELQILDELHRPEHFALRSTSILAQYEAVRAGAGLAVLPAFVAAQDPSLVPVLPGVARFERTFWMSMPAEGKHVARMQAVWAFLKETAQSEVNRLVPQPHSPNLIAQ